MVASGVGGGRDALSLISLLPLLDSLFTSTALAALDLDGFLALVATLCFFSLSFLLVSISVSLSFFFSLPFLDFSEFGFGPVFRCSLYRHSTSLSLQREHMGHNLSHLSFLSLQWRHATFLFEVL